MYMRMSKPRILYEKRRFTLCALICCALALAPIWSISVVAAEPLLLEIARATAGFDERTNEPIVKIGLTDASKRLFAQFTSGKVGSKMELRSNGQILTGAVMREPLDVGSFQISGQFTVDQAKTLADRLSSLDAKIEVEFVSD
jgi:hypothetical protein